MLVRALSVHIARETAGAACIRYPLRPLFSLGREAAANSGRDAPREREGVSAVAQQATCPGV